MTFDDFIGIGVYADKYCENRPYYAAFHIYNDMLCVDGKHKGNYHVNDSVSIPLAEIDKASVIRAIHKVVKDND